MNPAAGSRNHPANWTDDQETGQSQKRNHQRLQNEANDHPSTLVTQREVFAIPFRSVVLAAMVVNVWIVKEGWHKKENAAQGIPSEAKPLELAFGQMNELVDEHQSSHVSEDRHDVTYGKSGD